MAKPGFFIASSMIQSADLSAPPTISASVPTSFLDAIGLLIVNWGLMEQQLNILLWALLKHNGTKEEGWRHRGFDKRYDLFASEWAKFSKGFPALERFPDETKARMRRWKSLRDAISHKEMILGMMMDGNHFIQFYNESRAKQKTKPYHASDFRAAADDASSSAGWLYWVCQLNAAWPLPSPDTQRLRSLPNTDRLRLPT